MTPPPMKEEQLISVIQSIIDDHPMGATCLAFCISEAWLKDRDRAIRQEQETCYGP